MSGSFSFEHTKSIISFGNVRLDLDSQTISSGANTIRLRSKLCLMLSYLIENKNRLISRDELIEKLWEGNQYTGMQAVTHSICQLRKLLHTIGNGTTYIETIPKRGYRLRIEQFDDDDDEYINERKANNERTNIDFSYSATVSEYFMKSQS